MRTLLLSALAAVLALPLFAAPPDFNAVYRLMDEKCLECHAKEDAEGGLVLEDHASLMKGGESGAAVVAGKSAESLMMKYLRGEVEKDGKRRFMPPGKREKLSPEELQLVAAWIDAGAKPSATPEKPKELTVPRITPRVPPRKAVNALAYEPAGKVLAVGRYGAVDLIQAETRQPIRTLEGLKGNVNGLAFSADGKQLFAASGENALFGEVKQWTLPDGKLVRTYQGHRDTLYAMALSPDGQVLATGSYDQQIKLWSTNDGAELRTLRGHNGAIFGLAFRPDGKLLASASADRTVKLWDVATGQRRDTLSQPTKEQVALAWSPDGKRLAAGGFDSRIRVWEVSADAKETTNPLLVARFAHEGPLMTVVWSKDGATLLSSSQDGTVKLWDGATIREKLLLEKQPDWPSALAFTGASVIAGRLDGTLGFYEPKTGAAIPAPKPAVAVAPAIGGISPRGIQSGREVELRVTGKGLKILSTAIASNPKLQVRVEPATSDTELKLRVTSAADLPRGQYEITLASAGEVTIGKMTSKATATAKVYVDELPQVEEAAIDPLKPATLPAMVWGAISTPGETDRISFDAAAGQTLVFDLASKSLGSKADATLALTDATGRVLASSNDFDKTGDPLIAYTFPAAGRYTLAIGDLQFGGSAEHFYRLTAGAVPFVTACFPLSVQVGRESEVQLIGDNLPVGATAKVKPMAAGEIDVPLDAAKYRSRRGFKVIATELPHTVEAEPNDVLANATPVQAPVTVSGRFQPAKGGKPDVDLYRFEAKAGSSWAIETTAAQRGSPADTKIEVLDADGKPVERLVLQAVRDSAVNFRGIDSNIPDLRVENWREMELNQLMYVGGEIAKIFRMPEGPDSGFQFYKAFGKRVGYFDTTPTAHAVDEPCYIVEPHPPGTKLISTGLPIFPLYYANDDDGSREIGSDSRLLFTAPKDGAYVVSVSDSRGLGGDRYAYDLTIREPKPGYRINLTGLTPAVPAGGGQAFTLLALRDDGFEGDVTVTIDGLPVGWKAMSPLVIQAGHQEARGAIYALAGAKAFTPAEMAAVKIVAKSDVPGVAKVLAKLPALTVAAAPQLQVALEPVAAGDTIAHVTPATPLQPQDPGRPFEITIAPGESIPAWIKITRGDKKAQAIRFDVENLPHGCIVDNLGLNGITLLDEQNEGEIHLKCDPWVQEMDRLIFAVTRGLGNHASFPVILHVRKKAPAVTAR
jgi:WD40 repeat protein/mono/diheme cytochrome c family protein